MNIRLNYSVDPKELARASVDFLDKRPFIKLLKISMNCCCILAIIALFLKMREGVADKQDFIFVMIVSTWMFMYKLISYGIILFVAKMSKNSVKEVSYELDASKLQLQNKGKLLNKQSWKQLKKIYKNSSGYIVPFVGMTNGGKFAWLPKKSFAIDEEEQFISHINKMGIKIVGA